MDEPMEKGAAHHKYPDDEAFKERLKHMGKGECAAVPALSVQVSGSDTARQGVRCVDRQK